MKSLGTAVVGIARALRWAGACVAAGSRPRGGAKFLLVCSLVLISGCASTSLDFHSYRACNEEMGTMRHDPGLVVAEWTDESNRRHHSFLPDRLKSDSRMVKDVTRVNRICPLITGMYSDQRTPIGDRWNLSEGPHS
jgi:hypothetical protein